MRHEPFSQFDRPTQPREPEVARDCTRAAMEIVAEVRVGYGQWQRVRLMDVSSTGFRLAWLPRAEPGADLKIRIPGLEQLSATVRWRRETGVGCQFERPLSVYVFEHLVRVAGR